MEGASQDPDRALLLRNRRVGGLLPSFWGVRTVRWKYLRHNRNAGRPRVELYDLDADPHELENLHGKPAYTSVEASLRTKLEVLRSAPPAR